MVHKATSVFNNSFSIRPINKKNIKLVYEQSKTKTYAFGNFYPFDLWQNKRVFKCQWYKSLHQQAYQTNGIKKSLKTIF